MTRWTRSLIRLAPPHRRKWIRAALAERHHVNSLRARARWTLGTVVFAIRSRLVRIPKREKLMRIVLGTLSALNMAMGLLLVGVFVFTTGNALIVLGLGAGLLLQGGYTLVLMVGALSRWERLSSRLLLVGQTVAMLVGVLGFTSSALYNISPPNGDYEYGPLTVGFLIAAQAALSLWHFGFRSSADAGLAPR